MSLASEPPPSASRPYSPPEYLLSSTGLSRDTFISQFEGFRHSLQYVEIAPELVFERLVGNLREVFSQALIQERIKHVAAEDAWRIEKAALQSELDRATASQKLAEIRSLQPLPEVREHRTARIRPTAVPPGPMTPVVATAMQSYLQFWFSSHSSCASKSIADNKSTHVRAAETSIPISYGIGTSWPEMGPESSSTDSGYYDSRMDPRVNTATVPTTVTHVVSFQDRYCYVPKVTVWLTGLSASCGANVRVKVTAINITTTGFMLEIINSGNQLGSVGAAWAVWPVTTTVGSMSIVTPGDEGTPRLYREGVIPARLYIRLALLAISEVDLMLGGGVWIDVAIPLEANFAWVMNAGPPDAIVLKAGLVYALV